MFGNSVWKNSLKTYLSHKLFKRDKECYWIGQYIHHWYKRNLLIIINQSNICVFTGFCGSGLLLLRKWYSWFGITALVELVGDLVSVLTFWFRTIKCGWFFMLGIIASNLLKIGNGWAIVVKYVTTVVYVGTHFFPPFLENSRSHSKAYNLISSKKHAPIIWERDWWFYGKYAWYYVGRQNYEKCDCRDQCIKKNWKVTSKAEDF